MKVNRELLEDIVFYHKTLIERGVEETMQFDIIKRYEMHKFHCPEKDLVKAYQIADRYLRINKITKLIND